MTDNTLKKTLGELVAHLDEISVRLRQTEEEVKRMRATEWDIRATVSRLKTMIEYRFSPEESVAA
jgi:hypothetical protein